jgi:Xaa-Pro aminopeptidase
VPGIEALGLEELGFDELAVSERPLHEIEVEISARAVERLGLRNAAVPNDFPLALADRLRADGVRLRTDQASSIHAAASRAKPNWLGSAARSAPPKPGWQRRQHCYAMRATGRSARSSARRDTRGVRCGWRGRAAGHHRRSWRPGRNRPRARFRPTAGRSPDCRRSLSAGRGLGLLGGHDPDLRDRRGPAEVVEQHRLTLEALRRAADATHAGARGVDVDGAACEVFEAVGHPTQRSKDDSAELRDGFFHSLGHGVGLEVHEAPALGRTGHEPLVSGDVVTLEPGTYRQGFGGVRLEDLVLVTEGGCEVMTSYPYDLRP